MRIDEIREAHSATPFRPFTLHLADGRGIPVLHHEFMISATRGRTAMVCQPDDSYDIIDVPLVTGLTFRRAKPASRKR